MYVNFYYFDLMQTFLIKYLYRTEKDDFIIDYQFKPCNYVTGFNL